MKQSFRGSLRLRRYYRKIRSYLPCSGRTKKRIVREIYENVNGYLEEHPNADISEIENRFGSPCAIAAGYLSDMSETELMYSLNISQKAMKITASTFLAIALLWTIAVGSCMLIVKDRVYPVWDQGIVQQAALLEAGE